MRVLAVLSGKGGVGKTTTVSNLSAALTTEFRRYVIGIDGNVTTPNLGLHLGIFSFPHTLNDVSDGVIPLREAIYICSNGVRIIPAQLSFDSSDIDLTVMRNSLNELDADLVLIDSCPGLGNEIVPTLKITDEALVVTNPEIPAITDALRAIEIAGRYNVPVKGVILNRVRNDKYELSVTEVESIFDLPVVSVIPEDPGVREGIFLGNPVVISKPFSPAAIEFKRLAGYLIGERYRVSFIDRMKWLFSKVFKKSKSGWRSTEAPLPTPTESLVETPSALENEKLPKKTPEEPPKKLEPSENDYHESKLSFLRIKKDMAEEFLDGLEKKFREGQIDKDLYVKLKDEYTYELESYRSKITKVESGIDK